MDKNKLSKINTYLIVALAVLLLVNQWQLSKITGVSITTNAVSADSVIPTGTPEIYGKELGINYDDVSISDPRKADQTIALLANYDRTLELKGEKLDRYINIGSKISCEYCCGAQSIIFSNGQPACGCAHSYAMRGLAKYLLTYHADKLTDDQILEELGKWKTLFFPNQIKNKADVLKSKGIELNYINLASSKYRGIEKGIVSGQMVGGC